MLTQKAWNQIIQTGLSVCGFKYRDKIYNYFVNGRTGRAGGKTPISVWKVALTVVIIAAVIVGAYFGLKSAGII